MALLRLVWCVGGVYSMFLLWAIAQERLSVPFKSIDGRSTDKFRSAVFLGTCQSALSCISALIYLLLRAPSSSSLSQLFGLIPTSTPSKHPSNHILKKVSSRANGTPKANGAPGVHQVHDKRHKSHRQYPQSLLIRYLQCAVFITCASPFGFAALSYISYPAMVLGKSCKLIPVIFMNILLYRRKFAAHKYLVVAMVTIGLTVFMGYGDDKSATKSHGKEGAKSAYANLMGCFYLLINLILDGAVNSTQDEIFSRHNPTGQQMMFWINLFCTALSILLMSLPLPHIPVLHPSSRHSEFWSALKFIRTHPDVLVPLAQFSLTGALGQLFIYETLQHFGSLTLVTITLTRKLFTMLLSVVVYKHKLTSGQWLGTAIVFAGISVEAYVKRRDIHAKRVIQEKEKAVIKSL